MQTDAERLIMPASMALKGADFPLVSVRALAKERENRVDASVLCRLGGKVELAEDAADVRFDGLRRDVELLRDAAVRSSLREEREHLELSRRQLGERPSCG